jgi:hypothetical protein
MNEKLSYLSMEIEVSNYGTSIGMSLYVTQMVDEAQEHGLELSGYNSPGTKETYVIKEGAESVSRTEKVYFHSTVAKLLYVAKRAHPDIITVVMFLSTRVQEPRQDDVSKLLRVLGYLMSTKEQKLWLWAAGDSCDVVAYVDAAYALHHDSKSHTGVVIYGCNTMAYVALKKQK